jgi:large repetitive protein
MRATPRRRRAPGLRAGLSLLVALTSVAVLVPTQVARADEVDTDFVWSSSVPPASITVPASDATGADVTYSSPVAVDDGDEYATAGCLPASGTHFVVGTTTVNCSVADPDNDSSPLLVLYTSFTVTVVAPDNDLDFTPPSDITTSATNALGRAVSFATPTATKGDETLPPVSCASGGGLVSGSTFPIGTTTVTCSVTDADDSPSTVTHSFTVTVNDPGLTIANVNSILVAATGPAGAGVTFGVPKANDLRGAVTNVVCDHVSGATFKPGQSTVVCTATGDAYDVPSTATTSFGVYVNAGAPPPNPPSIGTATPGDGSASVAVGPPAPNGSYAIGSYTVTCTSSDGSPGTGSGKGTPIVVTGLTNGKTYTCTATASTATNPPQTSGPSGASNAFVPAAGVVTCTDTQVCNANSSSGSSSSAPAGSVDVTGTTDLPTGSISVVAGGAPVACPGSSIAVLPGTTMSDTGFSSANSLTVTITLRAVATGHAKVCYSSAIPFLSESHPTVPTAGVGILLRCSVVANQAPCLLSTRNTASTVIATILVPGGDPTFSVVLPTGRLVWPSTFPNGKVGTAYSTHLLSKGGKAPFHWKITSGTLPPGLAINPASGTVTGKPTAKGTFKCVVHVTDSEARPQSANISVSITIS